MPVSTLTTNGAAPLAEASGASSTSDPFELFTIGEMTTRVAEIAVEKASHPLSFLVRSLVGGAMVSFGVLLSLVVSTGVSSPGIASLLMGLAFGMSFALILVSGMSLITADMAAGAIAILQRRMTVVGYLRLLLIGLVGNCVGALTFVAVCAAAGGPYARREVIDLIRRLEAVDESLDGTGPRLLQNAVHDALIELKE